MAKLDVEALHLFDADRTKSAALAQALAILYPALDIQIAQSIERACEGAEGLVNGTPRGMVGHGGSAFPETLNPRHRWAFDAVYTPVDTPFLRSARAAGLSTMNGYELLLHQAVDCFRIFTGRTIELAELRLALAKSNS